MEIRQVVPEDHAEWLRMRVLLWPESLADHQREIREFFAHRNPDVVTLVIDRGRGRLGGLLEARVRNYAEGCFSSRVGYIEGWYVDPDLRRQGLGRRLVCAAEQWARQLGLVEMASDCDIDNEVSLYAHNALGYTEVERIICFRKVLTTDS
jgi:aminoglycoside 6'-N-acetyltransferase I